MIIADNLILIAAQQHEPFFDAITLCKSRACAFFWLWHYPTEGLDVINSPAARTAMPPCNVPNELFALAIVVVCFGHCCVLQPSAGGQVGLKIVQKNVPHIHLFFKVLGIFKHRGYFVGRPPQQGTLS